MAIRFQEGYKYQLGEDYSHQLPDVFHGTACSNAFTDLTANGLLVIEAGYAWDGPSGPTFDTKNFMRGSLVHDSLYQLMRENLLPRDMKEAADRELQRICIEDGMSKIRAWCVYQAVKRFGANATIHNKDIMVAP